MCAGAYASPVSVVFQASLWVTAILAAIIAVSAVDASLVPSGSPVQHSCVPRNLKAAMKIQSSDSASVYVKWDAPSEASQATAYSIELRFRTGRASVDTGSLPFAAGSGFDDSIFGNDGEDSVDASLVDVTYTPVSVRSTFFRGVTPRGEYTVVVACVLDHSSADDDDGVADRTRNFPSATVHVGPILPRKYERDAPDSVAHGIRRSALSVTCDPGFIPYPNGSCIACSPGTIQLDGACLLCPPGSFQDAYGATVCIGCNNGEYNPYPGNFNSSCLKCPEGAICPPGTIRPLPSLWNNRSVLETDLKYVKSPTASVGRNTVIRVCVGLGAGLFIAFISVYLLHWCGWDRNNILGTTVEVSRRCDVLITDPTMHLYLDRKTLDGAKSNVNMVTTSFNYDYAHTPRVGSSVDSTEASALNTNCGEGEVDVNYGATTRSKRKDGWIDTDAIPVMKRRSSFRGWMTVCAVLCVIIGLAVILQQFFTYRYSEERSLLPGQANPDNLVIDMEIAISVLGTSATCAEYNMDVQVADELNDQTQTLPPGCLDSPDALDHELLTQTLGEGNLQQCKSTGNCIHYFISTRTVMPLRATLVLLLTPRNVSTQPVVGAQGIIFGIRTPSFDKEQPSALMAGSVNKFFYTGSDTANFTMIVVPTIVYDLGTKVNDNSFEIHFVSISYGFGPGQFSVQFLVERPPYYVRIDKVEVQTVTQLLAAVISISAGIIKGFSIVVKGKEFFIRKWHAKKLERALAASSTLGATSASPLLGRINDDGQNPVAGTTRSLRTSRTTASSGEGLSEHLLSDVAAQ